MNKITILAILRFPTKVTGEFLLTIPVDSTTGSTTRHFVEVGTSFVEFHGVGTIILFHTYNITRFGWFVKGQTPSVIVCGATTYKTPTVIVCGATTYSRQLYSYVGQRLTVGGCPLTTDTSRDKIKIKQTYPSVLSRKPASRWGATTYGVSMPSVGWITRGVNL